MVLLKIYTFGEEKVKREILNNKEKNNLKYAYKKILLLLDNKSKLTEPIYKPLEEALNTNLDSVLKIVSILNYEEQSLLYKKYGCTLQNLSKKEDLTSEENIYIGTILLKKMRRYVKSLEDGYNVYDIYDLLETDNINLANLDETELFKLHCLFGINLDKKYFLSISEKNNFFKNSMTLKRKLLRQPIRMNDTFKSFFELFSEYRNENESQEEFEKRVLETFKHLKKSELEIVYKKYGVDLKNTKNFGQFTCEESKSFFRYTYYKIRYYLCKMEPKQKFNKSLLERLNNHGSHKDVLIALSNLNEEDKNFLRKYYGFSFDKRPKCNDIDDKTQDKIKYILDKIIRIINKNKSNDTGIKIEVLKKMRSLMFTKEFKELSKYYDNNFLLAYFIKKNYPHLSNEKIYSLTNVAIDDDNDIDEISKRVLNCTK